MADDDASPGQRRLTVFGVLEPGWGAGAPADATVALSLLYPEVPLTAAEAKKLEKAKKFREKQLKQEKEEKEKDGASVSPTRAPSCVVQMLCAARVPRVPLVHGRPLDLYGTPTL